MAPSPPQAKVVIVKRGSATGITTYEIRRDGIDAVRSRINTWNKFLLLGSVSLRNGRVVINDKRQLSRVIAAQSPRLVGLHWVTYSFNVFNRDRQEFANGFKGVNDTSVPDAGQRHAATTC
ncbi:uncharacterized protein SRS1_25014 [Sporisorium reilianum f. sp. reilianum]|uniref:Uncharacterized protein n=1 Tax=Sporisorium reilianum f. sp. reilianum TaxID=72559 RepID=A0A2N8UKT5_9BASI|nr:uncharacterized protein SRS1_25014 [Sporisorium reilianum f. sp. reilianum]